ncbi:MAG TPA: helicase-related protein [Magnetospirillaceae bacterium]|nr:helicase-related protein [Magnetospirillaceae bacterium]
MTSSYDSSRVVAVLGPTNTGKTHLALERMLGHRTGMIGFPLRLLARENYDRIAKLKGKNAVALITGEEKIIPPYAQWFVCTVESMPLDRAVDFLAIDEIQLCGDAERGHIFTDRLLHARGTSETMFLGSETIKPLIRRLVPRVEFITRPRLSTLSYTGPAKLTRLPGRSAIVAFSAAEVYALAEMIRRQRGGAAVVLGALSPRTRNAQVALYQAGEVDYLVATDAIGMGLNMDVDHVAFAAARKFDGQVSRGLEATEVAQIAGRAGRHMNNGTFGTTADVPGLDPQIVEAVENHHFAPLKKLQWRNSELRFTSVPALISALDRLPDDPGLVRARESDDRLALSALSQDADTMSRAKTPDRVRLLWEVCQIPDFRKSLAEQHSRLLAAIFHHLTEPAARLPAEWLDRQVKRLDRTDGDIDTLMNRIANVRTWTYISHRGDWVENGPEWQERTRAIEDRLSDALHQRLTQRFIDRRTAVLMRKMRSDEALASLISDEGQVTVEGEFVGSLQGFRFAPDRSESGHAARAVSAAARAALKPEIAERISQLAAAPDAEFDLDGNAQVTWRGAPVASLQAGPLPLQPLIEILPSEWIDAEARRRLETRLSAWLAARIAALFGPLLPGPAAELSGPVRGLLFHLAEQLGSMPRARTASPIDKLTEEERRILARLGVRFGTESLFLPALLKPEAQRWRAALWCLHRGQPQMAPPPPGRVSLPADHPAAYYEAVGYRRLGGLALRLDMLERFAAELRKLARSGPISPPAAWMSQLGIGSEDMSQLIEAMGYKPKYCGDIVTFHHAPKRQPRKRPQKVTRIDENSPFAVLKRLQ